MSLSPWDARHPEFDEATNVSRDDARIAHLRAMAGFISNVADSLEVDGSPYSTEYADGILNGEENGAAQWARDAWWDYLS